MFLLAFSRAQELLSAKRHGFITGVFFNFWYCKKLVWERSCHVFLLLAGGFSSLLIVFVDFWPLHTSWRRWRRSCGGSFGEQPPLRFSLYLSGCRTCGQLFPVVWCVLRSLCWEVHLWPTPAPYLARPVIIFSFEASLSVWGQRDGSFFDCAVFISKFIPIYGQLPVITVPASIVLTLLVTLYAGITDLNYIAGIWAHKWK